MSTSLQQSASERTPSGHPSAIHVREDALLQGVLEFLAERIFGKNRREVLDDSLVKIDERDRGLSERRLRSLQKEIDVLDARQSRLLRALESDDDPGGVMFRQIRERMVDMEAQRKAAIEELAQIGESQTPQDPELLDFLPVGEIVPPGQPTPELYRLFESLRLQLHYEHGTHRVRCRVALRSESIDEVLSASANVVRTVVDVFCAPSFTQSEPFVRACLLAQGIKDGAH